MARTPNAENPNAIPPLGKLGLDSLTLDKLCMVSQHLANVAKYADAMWAYKKLDAESDPAAATKELEMHRIGRLLPTSWRNAIG